MYGENSNIVRVERRPRLTPTQRLIVGSLIDGPKRWKDLENSLVKTGKMAKSTLSNQLNKLMKLKTVGGNVDTLKRPSVSWYSLITTPKEFLGKFLDKFGPFNCPKCEARMEGYTDIKVKINEIEHTVDVIGCHWKGCFFGVVKCPVCGDFMKTILSHDERGVGFIDALICPKCKVMWESGWDISQIKSYLKKRWPQQFVISLQKIDKATLRPFLRTFSTKRRNFRLA